MATTKALLDHLRKHPEGLRFVDIQRFVVESNGLDFDKKVVANQWEVNGGAKPRYIRQYRGYWCDHLCGGMRYVQIAGWPDPRCSYIPKQGLLSKYCDKVGKLYKLKEGV